MATFLRLAWPISRALAVYPHAPTLILWHPLQLSVHRAGIFWYANGYHAGAMLPRSSCSPMLRRISRPRFLTSPLVAAPSASQSSSRSWPGGVQGGISPTCFNSSATYKTVRQFSINMAYGTEQKQANGTNGVNGTKNKINHWASPGMTAFDFRSMRMQYSYLQASVF